MAVDANSEESQKYSQLQALMLQGARHNDRYAPSLDPQPLSADLSGPRLDAPPPQTTKSAPEMGLLLNDSYPHARPDKRAAMTFTAFDVDIDGDTQPMPSQVYHGYKIGSNDEEAANNSMGTGHTPSGTGEVDLMPYLDTQPAALDVHSIAESAEDDESQDFLSSMKRDTQPKTPALAGIKRYRNGDTISPTTISKTPGSGLGSLFGPLKSGPPMTTTQLFDNTQAVSSPAPDTTRSDPLESRPSPDFIRAIVMSPSVRALSSPVKSDFVEHSKLLAGPREVYRPMDESQRNRQARRSLHDSRLPPSSRIQFDDDSQMSENFGTGHLGNYPNHEYSQSLQRSSSKGAEPHFLVPDGTAVIEVSDHVSDNESMDEYDEYSQAILPSQGRASLGLTGSRTNTPEVQETDMEVAGSPVVTEGGRHINRPISRDSNQPASSGRDLLTIANSQPAKVSQSCPPRPVEPSSMASFVPGSQVGLPSSQIRALLEAQLDTQKSSSLPKPPMTSQIASELPGESNMPSSPPGMGFEERPEPILADSARLQTPGTPAYAALFEHSRPLEESSGIDEKLKFSRTTKSSSLVSTSKGNAEIGTDGSEQHEIQVQGGQPTETNASESNKASMFTTAATHISTSGELSAGLSQAQRSVSESPVKSGRVRRFEEMANDPTPPNSVGDIDVSIGMEVVGDADREFSEKMRPHAESDRTRRERHASIKQALPTIAASALNEKAPKDRPRSNPDTDGPARTGRLRKRRKFNNGVKRIAAHETEHDVHGAGGASTSAVRNAEQTEDGRNDSADPSQKENALHEDQAEPSRETSPQPERRPSVDQAQSPAAPPSPVSETETHSRNRVLALFNGSVTGYWPATCTSATQPGPSSRYDVRFDDGTCTSLERHHVCAFDLRVGDTVKVDRPNMRKHIYIVHGFDGQEDAEHAEYGLTDVHGHHLVQVRLKRKDSAKNPRVAAATAAIDRPVTIPIAAIYVTQSMWIKFNARTYNHNVLERQQTPSVDVSAPPTPSSRTRRQTLNSGQLPGMVSSITFRSTEGSTFSNMAFAVSYSSPDSDTQRDRLVSLITAQSGLVVQKGLHELFHPVTASSTPSTLHLKADHSTLGFVALIADAHSRTQKYIQALALGLPTLHYRWIEDSVRAGRPLPWARYLLPAGASRHLCDALRSRTLPVYSPADAALARTIEARDRLLPRDAGVLLLLADRKKDMRAVYAFLSLAMGARRVAFAESVPAARDMLRSAGEEWGWVHCAANALGRVVEELGGAGAGEGDGGAAAVPKGGGARKAKRKRSLLAAAAGDEEGGGEAQRMDVVLPGGVRVVSDEWVIQSLILGS